MAQNLVRRVRNIVKHLGILKAIDKYEMSVSFH
jgi:hypothetical protein